MNSWHKVIAFTICLAVLVVYAPQAYAAGGVKPIWAGQSFDPARQVTKVSSSDTQTSFAFSWWAFFTGHEPGKGIDWVRFHVNVDDNAADGDPPEIKNLKVAPAPGWTWAATPPGTPVPNSFVGTVQRSHVPVSSGTTPFATVHFGITGTHQGQNSDTDLVFDLPFTVHFVTVSNLSHKSTTTIPATWWEGVGVDHHPGTPTQEKSWGWIKGLFR